MRFITYLLHTEFIENVVTDLFQHHLSDHQQVRLQHVVLHSTGRYKCEVSTDGPPFKTVYREAYMEVIGELYSTFYS